MASVAVSVSASGDNVVFTNVDPAAKIVVNGWALQAASAVSVFWKDSVGNTYMAPIPLSITAGDSEGDNPSVPDPTPQGGFALPAGANLILNLSGAVSVTGNIDIDLV